MDEQEINKQVDEYIKLYDIENQLKEKDKEIERLNNIIREAREYIEHENFKRNILVGVSTKKYTRDILNKILKILDKEKENG